MERTFLPLKTIERFGLFFLLQNCQRYRFQHPKTDPFVYGWVLKTKDTFWFRAGKAQKQCRIFSERLAKKIGYTLRVGAADPWITDRRNWDIRSNGKKVRLGVEEGKKMMGLPSSVFRSNSQAMKQLGNAVVVRQ